MAFLRALLCPQDVVLAPFDVELPPSVMVGFVDTIEHRPPCKVSENDTLWRSAFHSTGRSPRTWRGRLHNVLAVSAEMTIAAIGISLLVSWYPIVVDGVLFVQADPYVAKTVVLTLETSLSGNVGTVAMAAMMTLAHTKWFISVVVAELVIVAGTARAVVMMLYHSQPPSWFIYCTGAGNSSSFEQCCMGQ